MLGDGEGIGDSVGIVGRVGASDGLFDGGGLEGEAERVIVGICDGRLLGIGDGAADGDALGNGDGAALGVSDGVADGDVLGLGVGLIVGVDDGTVEGILSSIWVTMTILPRLGREPAASCSV
mmetsp:Transcript_20463/g.33916  ORF Transcript_20463/g.33916 Transcript_20463/m.33916 type:complete len:122 (-) Transcript_20463:1538-1903(-)